MIAYFGLFCFS